MSRAAEHVDASLTFVGVPVGPFEGRAAIAAAYRENPPSDTMSLGEVREYDGTDLARFRWAGGGTGTMELAWAPDGAVRALTVRFDRNA